ncbi:hypothetical protein [Vibrio alginolyticus]|uniref:hypothetical protein n=1 Tax=Vibrio alginolyticus TaxID=663 RepID=UPI0007229672|nr:hypothetical protein [Vibrio alginolyticus]ALR91283.1 hypothetical protein AT730_02350 [Vibrio alginolyticus]MBY7707954.1 hypothetical protein [Vibrio alginolyticus]
MSKDTRSITLRAFAIKESDSLSKKESVLEKLKLKLDASKSSINRCMLLNESDPNKEKDVISNFEVSTTPESLFCTMVRIVPGEDVQHVTSDLLNKKSFTIEELENVYTSKADNNIPSVCKEHYYFSIDNNHIVTNLRSGKTIRDLKVYLAWFLENDLFEAYPMTDKPEDIDLKDIRNITFSGESLSYHSPESRSKVDYNNDTDRKSIKLNDLAGDLLSKLFSDTKSLSQHDMERYISAELVIKLKKLNQTEQEDFNKTMGALLAPVADLDNIAIKPKKGKTITGRALAKEKAVEIPITKSGKLVEQALRQEMSMFITELKNA